MKRLRQPVIGIIAALASLVIIIGIVSLVLIEGRKPQSAKASTPGAQTSSSTHLSNSSTPGTQFPAALFSPTPTLCPTPAGWTAYLIQSGDTLVDLADSRGVSTEDLVRANCLNGPFAMPGSTIALPVGLIFASTEPASSAPTEQPLAATSQPAAATATFTLTATSRPAAPSVTVTGGRCQEPSGWVVYTVVRGDALAIIARHFGTTVAELQRVNCLGNSTLLHIGDRLYVPGGVTTSTPGVSGTITPTGTSH
jgi:LysM repeat protein